ncbi:MAG: DUF4118 domain-containing protein [Pseudomonadota bacterium]
MQKLLASSAMGLRGYAMAAGFVAVSTTIGHLMAPRWGTSAVDLVFLPAVIAAAVFAGMGPALLAAVASALAYNYYFTAPFHTFVIHHPADVVTVVVLFLVALVTSQLAASIRSEAQLAERHAERNATIAGFARQLLSSAREPEIAAIAVTELSRLFDCNAILLVNRPEPRMIAASSPGLALNPSDIAIAALVAATAEPAGRGISRGTAIEWQFYPIIAADQTIAVAGLARDDGMPAVVHDTRSLLTNLLDQAALAFERARLESEARDFTALRERDQVRSSLLSSIGSDLDPAVAAIAHSVDSLRRSDRSDKEVVAEIGAQAVRLKRYLANLADLSPVDSTGPIEAGGLSIDLFRRSVTRNGEEVHLTPKEFAVLAELAKHPGRVLSHAHLLRTAWGPAQEKQSEYLRVAIRNLRNKLEASPGQPKLILNEPAVGYRLKI